MVSVNISIEKPRKKPSIKLTDAGVSKGRSIADGLSGTEIEPGEIITGRIINHLRISNSYAPSIKFIRFISCRRIWAFHAIYAKDQLILKLSSLKLILGGVMSRNSLCKPKTTLSAEKFQITDTKLQIKSDLKSDIIDEMYERANFTRNYLKN